MSELEFKVTLENDDEFTASVTRGNRLNVEINSPWAGDSGSFCQRLSIFLDEKEAIDFLAWLTKVLGAS